VAVEMTKKKCSDEMAYKRELDGIHENEKIIESMLITNIITLVKLCIYAFFFAVVFIAGTGLVLFAWYETSFRSFYYMVGYGSQFCFGMLMLMFPVILAYYFTEPIKHLLRLKFRD
jgi:flagellar biosynthesis protein FlhB